jgi:hypothetical protein
LRLDDGLQSRVGAVGKGEDREVMAYRLQYTFKARNAVAFGQTVRLLERLQAISRDHGFQERRIMTQAFGPFNQLVVNVDYADLASYERESELFFVLPEVQEVIEQLPAVLREADPGETTMWEDVSSEPPASR